MPQYCLQLSKQHRLISLFAFLTNCATQQNLPTYKVPTYKVPTYKVPTYKVPTYKVPPIKNLPIKYLPIKFLYCDLVCKNFMRATNFRFKADIDDVVILKKSGMGTFTVETKCFRPLPGRSFSFFFTHFRFREMLLLRTLAFSATR